MTLRDKYRALLGAFSQEDSGVWSGDITADMQLYQGYWNGNKWASASYNRTYKIAIPPNATTLKIIGATTASNGYNCLSNSETITTPPDFIYDKAINNPIFNFEANKYKYALVVIHLTSNCTFEFSKNSGGY